MRNVLGIGCGIVASLCFGVCLFGPIWIGIWLYSSIGLAGWLSGLLSIVSFFVIATIVATQNESWEIGERPFMFMRKYPEYRKGGKFYE